MKRDIYSKKKNNKKTLLDVLLWVDAKLSSNIVSRWEWYSIHACMNKQWTMNEKDERYTLSTCVGLERRGLSSLIQPSGRLNFEELPVCSSGERVGLRVFWGFRRVLTMFCGRSWCGFSIGWEGSHAIEAWCLCFANANSRGNYIAFWSAQVLSYISRSISNCQNYPACYV